MKGEIIIDIPTCCDMCKLCKADKYWYNCRVNGGKVHKEYSKGRPEHCPIVKVRE